MRILSKYFFDSEPTLETNAFIIMLAVMAVGALFFGWLVMFG